MVDAVAADADEILEEPLAVVVGEGEARPFCFAGLVVEEAAIFASRRSASDAATWHRVMEELVAGRSQQQPYRRVRYTS